MPYISTVKPGEATGKVRAIYDAATARAGGVANIVQLMSLDAAVCQNSLGLYASTMLAENSLDRSTCELLATVVSNVNDCYY